MHTLWHDLNKERLGTENSNRISIQGYQLLLHLLCNIRFCCQQALIDREVNKGTKILHLYDLHTIDPCLKTHIIINRGSCYNDVILISHHPNLFLNTVIIYFSCDLIIYTCLICDLTCFVIECQHISTILIQFQFIRNPPDSRQRPSGCNCHNMSFFLDLHDLIQCRLCDLFFRISQCTINIKCYYLLHLVISTFIFNL